MELIFKIAMKALENSYVFKTVANLGTPSELHAARDKNQIWP